MKPLLIIIQTRADDRAALLRVILIVFCQDFGFWEVKLSTVHAVGAARLRSSKSCKCCCEIDWITHKIF